MTFSIFFSETQKKISYRIVLVALFHAIMMLTETFKIYQAKIQQSIIKVAQQLFQVYWSYMTEENN